MNRAVPDNTTDPLARPPPPGPAAPSAPDIERTFVDLGRARAPIRPGEVTGIEELRSFGAEIYGVHDPWTGRARAGN